MMVRRIVGAIAVCATASASALAQHSTPQRVASENVEASRIADVLAKPVTVELTRVSLKNAVEAIAASANVRISYQGQMVDEITTPVTLHASKLALGTALEAVLRGTDLYAVPVAADLVNLRVARASAVADGSIAGKVVDVAKKTPIVGATVTVEGTKLVVRTDAQGAFKISAVSPGTYTITIRRLGYGIVRQSVRVAADDVATADVALAETVTALEQVVTTVTGPQRRVELGNAIAVIKADSLVKEAPITSVSQLLAARVPGLRVMQTQGTVGGNVSLQIRGQTSINLSSEPIVIVDGVRYSSQAKWQVGSAEAVSPLNDLNPNDIETVEVVKGPSAATLYGTDAAHGVIVITTKRGAAGRARWTVFAKGMTDAIPKNSDAIADGYYGWPDGCTLYNMSLGFCTQDSVTRVPNVLATPRTSILRPARSWGSGAAVSGGASSLRYYFSGNFDDLTGAVALPRDLVDALKVQRGVKKLPDELLRPNVQTNLNLRSNVTAALGPMLDLTVSGGYVRGNTRSIDLSDNFSPFAGAFRTTPTDSTSLNLARNQFAQTTTENVNRFISSVNAQARPLSWLTGRGTMGVDVAIRSGNVIAPRDSTRGWDSNPEGYVQESRNRQMATSVDAGITATAQRGALSSRTSIGGQYVRSLNDRVASEGWDLPPGVISISRAARWNTRQDYDESVTLGTYLEEVVGVNDRLFLTGALRIDGASAFGSGYTAATYPKVSASWLLSQEPFMPRISALGDIRVRAALGVSGQQPASIWALPTWDVPSFNLDRLEAGGYGRPVFISQLGDPNLRPERGREFEMGVDAGFLDRRLQTELTWYRRKTTDQIVWQVLPDGLGGRRTNLGVTTEHGFEAQLSATLVDKTAFHWQATLRHADSRTKLVRLNNSALSQKQPEGGFAEGYPIGARFSVPLLGYGDTNQNGIIEPDEVQLGDSAVYAGINTFPRNQTLNTTVGLFRQRLRISALLDRQSGGTLINKLCDITCRASVDRTAPLGDQAIQIARNMFVPGYRNYEYIQQVNFTRLREVSLALTLPSRLLRMVRAASGTVSLSARNLGLWTNYDGPDPESTPQYPGQDPYYQYSPTAIPQSRTWALRCDLGL